MWEKFSLYFLGIFFFSLVFFSISSTHFLFADAPDCSLYPENFIGSGTFSDPFEITTLTELQCIGGSPETLSAHYKLTNTIDASETNTWNNGMGFLPIGNATTPFTGGFDGSGYTIENLYINNPNNDYTGLFGNTSSATQYIRNVGLVNVNITGGYRTGGLAGKLQTLQENPVQNVFVTGQVFGGVLNAMVGGLASVNFALITNSYTDVTVKGGYKGGGFVAEHRSASISNSYANGNVLPWTMESSTNRSRVGGFIAYATSSASLLGTFYNQERQTVASGPCPTSSDTSNFGGCAGKEVTGKTDAQMQNVDTFTLTGAELTTPWDFLGNPNEDEANSNFWGIETGGYPQLNVFSHIVDQDGDGYPFSEDCNDNDFSVHTPINFYPDSDGDGFGDAGSEPVLACGVLFAPDDYVDNDADCEPENDQVYPRTAYRDSDGDGYGDMNSSQTYCGISPPTGYVVNSTDCDDNESDRYEIFTYYRDSDEDSFGDVSETITACGSVSAEPPTGYVVNSTDCNDVESSQYLIRIFYRDNDGDGYGNFADTSEVCANPETTPSTGYTLNSTDCDDTDEYLYPGNFIGLGIQKNPYQIRNVRELQCIGGSLGALSSHYKLTNTIDASETNTWNNGMGFLPIGNATTPFTGGFDGSGYTIENLFINNPNNDYTGLFGNTSSATQYIRNVGLVNVNITGGYRTGGLAGLLQTKAIYPVQNVFVTGQINAGKSNAMVGGLASVNFALITNSYTDVTVKGGYKGGGFVAEHRSASISNSYANGNVLPWTMESSTNRSRVGGFIAYATSSASLLGTFYNQERQTVASGPCPTSSDTSNFGGCAGKEVTGKTDAQMQNVDTFTLTGAELTTPWDFLGNPNEDDGIRNFWKYQQLETFPSLSLFSGEVDQDGDGYPFSEDCNDNDPSVHTPINFYPDSDGDGFGDSGSEPVLACGVLFAPDDYVDNDADCEPKNDQVYPRTFYLNSDGDGFGDMNQSSTQCVDGNTLPLNYVRDSTDCNDLDAQVYPRTFYLDSDGDGYGLLSSGMSICGQDPPQGYVATVGDGDDSDPNINPSVGAHLRIEQSILTTNIPPLGINISTLTGGTNMAINNHVKGSGFEPAMIRQLERVQRSGKENEYPWFEWDYNGGIDMWDTRNTGFGNGAVVRFYRLVDEQGDPLSYAEGMRDIEGAQRVIFLGEATVPLPSEDFPSGGWISEEGSEGQKRVYVDNKNIDLLYGDYAFISLSKVYVEETEMHSRLIPYRNASKPNLSFLFGGATAKIVPHSANLPSDFIDHGESFLEIESSTFQEVMAGQYMYHSYDDGEGQWYSQLTPGKPYRVEVWLKKEDMEGDGDVSFRFYSDNIPYYTQANQVVPWKVTDEWRKYSYDFIAPQYPSEASHIAHTLVFRGPGKLHIDNFILYRNDAEHNFKPFGPHSNSLEPILNAYKPNGEKSTLRFHGVSYGNSSIESLLGNYGGSNFNINTGEMKPFMGMTLAQDMFWAYATGDSPEKRAVPWINFSEEYTEYEIQAIVEYLGVPYDPFLDTPETKPFAYKRYQQRDGNGTPWTEEFKEILLEYGNETWHQGSGGYGWHGFGEPGFVNTGGVEYGLFARYMFEEFLFQQPLWTQNNLSEKIKFVVGGNYVATSSGYGESAVQQSSALQYLSHANYVGPKWETGDSGRSTFNDHGVQESLIGLVSNPTVGQLISQSWQTKNELSSTHPYKLIMYEGGPSGYWTNPENPEVDELYGKSLAMGVSALDTWLFSAKNGYTYQNYWAFQSGKWWTSHTMPEQGGFRAHPGWLALEMRNKYSVGDTMIQIEQERTPTYLRNGSLVPLLSSYATQDDRGNTSIFVLSRKLDGNHSNTDFSDGYTPVTMELPFSQTPKKIYLAKLAQSDGSPADPRTNNRQNENITIFSQEISLDFYTTNEFTINENTGGQIKGMPPGTAFVYTFCFDDECISDLESVRKSENEENNFQEEVYDNGDTQGTIQENTTQGIIQEGTLENDKKEKKKSNSGNKSDSDSDEKEMKEALSSIFYKNSLSSYGEKESNESFQDIFDQKNAFKNNIDPFEIFSSLFFLEDSEKNLFDRIKQMALSYEKESPVITNIDVSENSLHIIGTGIPHSSLLLLIHSKNQKIEALVVDENGHWEFEREWGEFSLLPGQHTAYALSYDEKENIRSQAVFYDFFVDISEEENISFLKKSFPFLGGAILLCMFCLTFVPFFRSRLLK